MEKYGRDRQAIGENITWGMYFECWIIKATDTLSEYLLLFHYNGGFTNVPLCHVCMYMACLF